MAAVFAGVGSTLILAGVLGLIFSRRLNDRAARRWPPPESNKDETLTLVRIQAAGLVFGGMIFLLVGLAKG